MIYKKPIFSNETTYTCKDFGGIVTSHHPSTIGLDRLSQGKNIWNKDAVLSSRPGLSPTKNGIITEFFAMSDKCKTFYADFPFEGIPGYDTLCALVNESFDISTNIHFFVADNNGATHYLTLLEMVGANGKTFFEIKNILFIKSTPLEGSGIFIIIPVRRYDASTDTDSKYVLYYELSAEFDELISIKPEKFYRPLILKHGLGNAAPPSMKEANITCCPEGVNILGGNFEACFTCDGDSHAFIIPTSIAKDALVEIRLYTGSSTYVTTTVPPNSMTSTPFSFMQKEIIVYLNRTSGEMLFYTGNEPYAVPSNIGTNGLRVYSTADTAAAAYELLSCNSKPVSFDDRLFFPGGENRGNKIYYSGKNQPLYYCEKNYIPVGNSKYNLTAISLQNRYLIAFKEREIYRISISESSEISREELFKDNAILEMPVPKHTITRINGSIGCDMPTTIVTCANRLVWFQSDGAVYTLYGSNLYADGSVYELSGEISDQLMAYDMLDLSNVFAADLDGFYALGIDNKLYIMDARVSGFRYLSGHKAPSKNYSGLPWFIWEFPENCHLLSAFSRCGKHYFILSTRDYEIFYIATHNGEVDIVPQNDGINNQSLPEFSLSTPIIGNSLQSTQRITITAMFKNDAELQLFDENGVFKTLSLTGSEKLKSFMIPLHYKKGGVGITIKGKGNFFLKDITYNCSERKY